LKVLITVGIFPPDIGGPASFVPKIANILSKNGHEVIVVCLSDEKIEDELNYKVVRIIRRQNLIIRWIKTIYKIIKNGIGAKYIFVNGLPMESYIANLFLRKKLIRKIVGDWAWERGRNRGIVEDSFDEFQQNSHNLHIEIAKFSRGWTATKADLVITPSIHLSKVVESWGVDSEKLKVIYNGTTISDINEKINKDVNVINLITVGRLAPWKNIDTIIDAMNLLRLADIKFHLFIVGSGDLYDELNEKILNLNLDNYITLTGQKNSLELKEYYKKSHIYIQASGYEGLPHVLLEAINYELLVISTPIGGSNEILEDGKNGLILDLIEGKKPSSSYLYQLILKIIDNKDLQNEKIGNAKYLLQNKFDESKNFQEYLKVFQ
tara:strand:- start:217 stop:1353 length:1137 start_codon:yes stop_codon:yes gene_type:complete